MSTVAVCDDVEQEKARQRSIIDRLLGQSSGTAQQHTSVQNHAHEERELDVVDLKSLFSGRQFLFLGEEGEVSKELDEEDERVNAEHSVSGSTAVKSDDKRELLFFHWSNPDLANRLDYSFHSRRRREELERGWLKQRSAMRQLLRQSHRQAVRAARHGKRRQVWTIVK